jgi:hypothetical protein
MDIRETTEAFTAMDAYGHPLSIPKSAILHSVGDGSGFMGRIGAEGLASFVYLGSLYYVRKDAIETIMKPMSLTGRQRNTRRNASEPHAETHGR